MRACMRARDTDGILFENDAFCILKYCFEAVETFGMFCVNQESQDLAFICSPYIFARVHYSDGSRSLLLSPFLACGYIARALLHYFANIEPLVSTANGKDFLHNNKNIQRNNDAS